MTMQFTIILCTLTAIILFLLVKLFSKKNNTPQEVFTLRANNTYLQEQITDLQNQKSHLLENEQIQRIDNQDLIATNAKMQIQIQHLQELLNQEKHQSSQYQEKFAQEFELLANKILHQKSEQFTQVNSQNIERILLPLQEKIKNFEHKVEQTHKESIDHHAALRQQIFGLQQINSTMSEQTLNLTKALKGDNKMQGNWGEMILENVLEKSGLEKDREYFTQQSYTDDKGKQLRPDVVVKLPGDRHMVIDSKVSLVAYEQLVNTDDQKDKEKFLTHHLISIQRHIDSLCSKNYHELYKGSSPDFVLLFIPIETAFSCAIAKDPHLYTKAFEKNIVIVTPSTLLATLRTIESMWSQRKQTQNAFEIAKSAGLLYDKFVGFVQDLEKVTTKLNEAKQAQEQAYNKLSLGKGNLITSVQKLKDMGAKAKKNLQSQNFIDTQNRED
ncbi:DNA recombination protein RmuC [Myroides sp. LJL115]